MNFEFMKDLDIVHPMYRYCANAEDLAKAMPDNSLFTSRKSAEALAKLIYRIAHNEEAQRINFVDILNDPVVRKYVGNPSVINAFHFIRQKGNEAVHTMIDETEETALSVLKNLHFVFGETAKKLGLIRMYPAFNRNIQPNGNAEPITIDDVDEISRTMFADYIATKTKVESIFDEFDDLSGPVKVMANYLETEEKLVYASGPAPKELIALIQRYYGTLALMSHRCAVNGRNEYEENIGCDTLFSGSLVIKGDHSYEASDIYSFMRGLKNDLAKAEGFEIRCSYSGVNPLFDNDRLVSIERIVARYGKEESLALDYYEYYGGSGESNLRMYRDGQWLQLDDLYEEIDPGYNGGNGCCDGFMQVYYDFANYPELLAELKAVAQRHLNDFDLRNTQSLWEDDDEEVFTIAQLSMDTFQEVRALVDDVNSVLEPYLSECGGGSEYAWYHMETDFCKIILDFEDGKGFVFKWVHF